MREGVPYGAGRLFFAASQSNGTDADNEGGVDNGVKFLLVLRDPDPSPFTFDFGLFPERGDC